jgi:hypothetical protein
LGLVDRHPPGVKTKKRVWIAGDHLIVRATLQIVALPHGRQGVEQGGLSALARSDQGHTGKRPQIRPQQGFIGSLHTKHYQTECLNLQGEEISLLRKSRLRVDL